MAYFAAGFLQWPHLDAIHLHQAERGTHIVWCHKLSLRLGADSAPALGTLATMQGLLACNAVPAHINDVDYVLRCLLLLEVCT